MEPGEVDLGGSSGGGESSGYGGSSSRNATIQSYMELARKKRHMTRSNAKSVKVV